MSCWGRKKTKPNKKSPPHGQKGEGLQPPFESEELSEMKSKRRPQRKQPYRIPQQIRPLQPKNDEEIRLRREIDELREQLQKERKACEGAKSECKKVKAELGSRNEEFDNVKAELDHEKVERGKQGKQMQQWIDTQRQKDKIQESERNELINVRTKLQQKETDLSCKNLELQIEHNKVVSLQKKLENNELEVLQAGKEVIQLKHDKSILQRNFDDVSSQNNDLKEEVQCKKRELDLAHDEIRGKDTELMRVRDELHGEKDNVRRASEECNKMKRTHSNQMVGSDDKVSDLRTENDMLIQTLHQETHDLEIKSQRMEATLRDKEAEINQIKEKLNATNQLLERKSQTASQTKQKLRQSEEEREREASRALKAQNDLAARNEQTRHFTQQAEAILQQKEMELDNLKGSLGSENQHLQTLVESLKTERDSFVTERDSLKAQRDSLQKQYTEVKVVAENFQYRLSKEFGIRLASNETNMENISVKHRPAKIAEKFTQIESKEWVEAKEVLDEACDDERANIQLLLDIFECACQRAQKIFDQFLSSEACRLHSPITSTTNGLPTEQHRNEGNCLNIPDSIQKEIMAFLKGACGECDIESLIQDVVAGMKEKHGEDIVTSLQDTHVRSFVQACCRLAWQMAVQQPPLTALTSNTQYDDRCHQLWYKSPPPSKSEGVSTGEIDFYIWPELRHSGTVLQKGKVCLKPIVSTT